MSRRFLCPSCGADLAVVGVERLQLKSDTRVDWEVERCRECSAVLGGINVTPAIIESLPAVGFV